MAPHDTREIVIEYERIQLIRKKAKTEFTHCEACGEPSDFVGLDTAAELFETQRDDLLAYLRRNNGHHTTSTTTMLCINSLLATLKTRSSEHQFRLEGETK